MIDDERNSKGSESLWSKLRMASATLRRNYRDFGRIVVATPTLPLACVVSLLSNMNQGALISSQQWLVLERGLDAKFASAMSSILAAAVGVPAYILSGALADFLHERYGVQRLLTCAAYQALDMSCAFAALCISDAHSFGFWLMQAFAYAASNNFLPTFVGVIARLVDEGHTGSTIALVNGVAGLLGSFFAMMMGRVANNLIAAHHPGPFSTVLLVGACCGTASIPVILLLHFRHARDGETLRALCAKLTAEMEEEQAPSAGDKSSAHKATGGAAPARCCRARAIGLARSVAIQSYGRPRSTGDSWGSRSARPGL